jgi:hypothetical protein
MVFQIIIRSLVLKVLADKAFVCYDSTIPINMKTVFIPVDLLSVFQVGFVHSCKEVNVHYVIYRYALVKDNR